MIKELESEKIVTELLMENELLKPVSKNTYRALTKNDLGKFLSKNSKSKDKNSPRYSFITLGLWKW